MTLCEEIGLPTIRRPAHRLSTTRGPCERCGLEVVRLKGGDIREVMPDVDRTDMGVADAAPMSHANNHLALCRRDADKLAEPMLIADGSSWSIQASFDHLCNPRTAVMEAYDAVELKVLVGTEPEAWAPWKVGPKHYGFLPVEVIDQEIARRGGLRRWGNIANDQD